MIQNGYILAVDCGIKDCGEYSAGPKFLSQAWLEEKNILELSAPLIYLSIQLTRENQDTFYLIFCLPWITTNERMP